MSSNHTPNYQLSQWVRSDKVLMEDFNADNAKIDAALKAEADTRSAQVAALNTEAAKLGNCQIYHITYIGVGKGNTQTLTFPEQPALVLLVDSIGTNAFCIYGGSMSRTTSSTAGNFSIQWSENSLSWSTSDMNSTSVQYHAVALCVRD